MIKLNSLMIFDKNTFSRLVKYEIDKHIKSKYPSNLSKEEYEEIKDLLTNQLIDKINLTVILHTPEKELEKLNSLISAGNPKKLEEFVYKTIPNVEYLMKKEVSIFLKDLQ